MSGVPSTLATQPVRVSGPGFSRAINKSTTFTGLSAGVYTVTADSFITGQNKPTCRIHTPTQPSQQCTVVGGQTASVSVGYTSGPCDA